MTGTPRTLVFGLGSSLGQATAIANQLGLRPGAVEEREFEDGEHKARPLEDVQGADACVVHSLHAEPGQSVNDKLCRLLFFLATLRDHGAASVTAVAPYLCYGRKDVRTRELDPLHTLYLAQLFEAVGVGRVLCLDVHNPAAFGNAFRCRNQSLEAGPLLAEHLAPRLHDADVAVLSPDAGGFKRASAFRQVLQALLGRPVGLGMMEKRRSGGVVSGDALFGDVAGRTVLIVDDMIGTGTTLVRAARAARTGGARAVLAVASHGLFVGDAPVALVDPALDRVVVTDSVPPFRLAGSAAAARVETVPCAALFAEALRGALRANGPPS